MISAGKDGLQRALQYKATAELLTWTRETALVDVVGEVVERVHVGEAQVVVDAEGVGVRLVQGLEQDLRQESAATTGLRESVPQEKRGSQGGDLRSGLPHNPRRRC